MAISLVAVGQKWTATIANAIINAVNAMSRTVITPTSVAGSGVSLSGAKVVASAAASASVNGCFSSTYDAYSIEYDVTTSGAASFALVLRLSGTDATSAYDSQRHTAINATAAAVQVLNSASIVLSPGAGVTGRHAGTVKLYNPAAATATIGTALTGATANPMTSTTAVLYSGFVQHRTATAYDGFTVSVTTGTFTGWIRVQGIQ